eukprot:NODE_5951_length_1718_cov_3.438718.p1 GENE.NODE_5951_length_1718_cov_3.438718~~NODE_5951_length_1718_cov_3.438718.p1  ORF type:complete len:341 (+),score=97.99 NODE_5951_length_1718_cov_3.438718:296-1318(+)
MGEAPLTPRAFETVSSGAAAVPVPRRDKAPSPRQEQAPLSRSVARTCLGTVYKRASLLVEAQESTAASAPPAAEVVAAPPSQPEQPTAEEATAPLAGDCAVRVSTASKRASRRSRTPSTISPDGRRSLPPKTTALLDTELRTSGVGSLEFREEAAPAAGQMSPSSPKRNASKRAMLMLKACQRSMDHMEQLEQEEQPLLAWAEESQHPEDPALRSWAADLLQRAARRWRAQRAASAPGRWEVARARRSRHHANAELFMLHCPEGAPLLGEEAFSNAIWDAHPMLAPAQVRALFVEGAQHALVDCRSFCAIAEAAGDDERAAEFADMCAEEYVALASEDVQ